MSSGTISIEGRNVWRRAHADRVAFLVDAAAYYQALAASLQRARRSVLILGWDIDSRVALPSAEGGSILVVDLLNRLVEERPELEVHILAWDYSNIYLLEREFLPTVRFGLGTHERIHFHLDAAHPVGAAHHQKVVVIDDRVAYSGGLDITVRRWDTPEHRPDDERRLGPDGRQYAPFHDVQIAVQGPVAAALGDLARERWRRATGEVLAPAEAESDAWPASLAVDLTDVDVGIARTEPAFDERPEVREVEALFLDGIASASRTLYFENQYTSCPVMADALAKRLSEPEGPEVVIVCPTCCSGWLEQSTMGTLRSSFLRRVSRGDRYGRLRLYYPKVSSDTAVYVHAKVMVVDDRLARIGSANLSNRSMAVDTECDLVVESMGDDRVAAAIGAFRDRLVGEHLGVDPARVAEAMRSRGGLIGAIEALRSGERTLEPVDDSSDLPVEPGVSAVADPERPIDPEAMLVSVVHEGQRTRSHRGLILGAVLIAVMLGLAAMWRFTALGEWIRPNEAAAWLAVVRTSAFAPVVVMAAFVVLGLAMVPVNAMIIATGIAFGPVLGPLYAFLGSLASAAAGFALGRVIPREVLESMAGARVAQISSTFARRGILAIFAARLIPVAPFTLVNVVAGASRVRMTPFFAGTAVGMLPGILVLTLLGQQLLAAFHARTADDVALALAIGLGLVIAVAAAGGYLRHKLTAAPRARPA